MKHNYSGEIARAKSGSLVPSYRQQTKSSARLRASVAKTPVTVTLDNPYEPPRNSTLIHNADSEKRNWMLKRGKNNMVYYDNDQLKTIKTFFEQIADENDHITKE
jgi:hypothetical protein